MKTAIKVLLVLLLAGALYTAWMASKAIPMGAGYIAKTLCSEHFVAGRGDLDRIWLDILDIDTLFDWGSYELNETTQQVTAYFKPGLMKTTAVYRKGLGCTLATGIEPSDLQGLPKPITLTSAAATPLPELEGLNPRIESVLDEAFSEPFATSHRQTRAVVILRKGQIVAERYAPSFDRNTPLVGWSVTKSLTNTLIGMLVGDGLLELDNPAPVPEWQAEGDPRQGITIRHLLQMSSGLDFDEVYTPGSDVTNMLFAAHSAAAVAAAAPLGHEPGTRWYYSSGTSNILARIFRDATGGTLFTAQDFIRQRLYQPLGITSMVLEPDSSGSPVGSSFSFATARDWARLGQFWLQDGQWEGKRLLPEGWMQWSVSPAPAADKGQYGAQFWLNAGIHGEDRRYPEIPTSMYAALGYSGQVVAVFPEQEVVVVRLGFTTDDSWDNNVFLAAVLAALDH